MLDFLRLDIADGVFLLCLLVGGVLLLVSVLVGEILDAVDIPFLGEGSGIVPPLLAFVALFGAGGLLGRQTFGLAGDQAAFLALGVGTAGAFGTGALLRLLRRSEAGPGLRLEDLVGRVGSADTPMSPGSLGQVTVDAMGAGQRFLARSDSDLSQGQVVRVTAVVGGRLVVEPLSSGTTTSQADRPS